MANAWGYQPLTDADLKDAEKQISEYAKKLPELFRLSLVRRLVKIGDKVLMTAKSPVKHERVEGDSASWLASVTKPYPLNEALFMILDDAGSEVELARRERTISEENRQAALRREVEERTVIEQQKLYAQQLEARNAAWAAMTPAERALAQLACNAQVSGIGAPPSNWTSEG